MQIDYDMQKSELLVRLSGEIDHHNTMQMRSEIDTALCTHTPHTLVLDFRDVTFMDSSGIGLIMGRYKILQPLGGEIILRQPSAHIARVLRLAGMERLAELQIHTPEEVSAS
ncbi:MAG: anti-sigma factor antagonist [Oscillospiraceae bacterium]|nr:anti-sigma factor antagonist [Oscillospiraceae bacterium]